MKKIDRKFIVCSNPNCNYQGPAIKRARGSVAFGLVLLCFGLLPGVLYFYFLRGYNLLCPQCGVFVRRM